jgi:hypothetical protein
MTASLADRLGTFVGELEWSSVPPEIADRARDRVLDAISTAVADRVADPYQPVRELLEDEPAGKAAVLASGGAAVAGAVAAAKAMRLSPAQVATAATIGANFSGGLMEGWSHGSHEPYFQRAWRQSRDCMRRDLRPAAPSAQRRRSRVRTVSSARSPMRRTMRGSSQARRGGSWKSSASPIRAAAARSAPSTARVSYGRWARPHADPSGVRVAAGTLLCLSRREPRRAIRVDVAGAGEWAALRRRGPPRLRHGGGRDVSARFPETMTSRR